MSTEAPPAPAAPVAPPAGDSLLTQPPAAPQAAAPPIEGAWKGFAGEDGTFAPDWHAHLPEDLGDSRAGLAKFRNVADLGKSYIEAQKVIGQKAGMVAVPGKDAKPEEIAAYRKHIGVPDTAEAYTFKPDSIPEGIDWNDDLAKPIAAIAHKHNIPPAAMKEIVAEHMKIELQRNDAALHLAGQELEKGKKELQGEWGDDFDKNITRVATVVKIAGVDAQSPGFRDPNVVRALYELSKKLSDDNFVTGDGVPIAAGGAAAAKSIQTDPSNPLYARYQNKDPDVVSLVRRYLQQK